MYPKKNFLLIPALNHKHLLHAKPTTVAMFSNSGWRRVCVRRRGNTHTHTHIAINILLFILQFSCQSFSLLCTSSLHYPWLLRQYFDEAYPTLKEQRVFETNLFQKTQRANGNVFSFCRKRIKATTSSLIAPSTSPLAPLAWPRHYDKDIAVSAFLVLITAADAIDFTHQLYWMQIIFDII